MAGHGIWKVHFIDMWCGSITHVVAMLCKLSWHQLDDKSDHSSFNIFDGTLFTCIAILLPFCKSVNFMRWKTMYFHFFIQDTFLSDFFHCWLFQDAVNIEDYSASNDWVTDEVKRIWKWFGLIEVLSQH